MNQDDDSMLDDYLEGKSSVSKIYRHGSKPQPPADLDEKILAQARRAVAAQPASVHKPRMMARRPRWLVPVSLAATVMLGVNLAYNLKDFSSEPTYSEDSAVVTGARFEAKRQQAAEQKMHTSNAPNRLKPVPLLPRTEAQTPPPSPSPSPSPAMETQLSRPEKTGDMRDYPVVARKRSERSTVETATTQDELTYAPAPATVTPHETVALPDSAEPSYQFTETMPTPERGISAVTDEPANARSRSSGFTVESPDADESFYATVTEMTPVYQCDLTEFGLSDLDLERQVIESRLRQAVPTAWKNAIVQYAERGEYRQACLELAAFARHYPNATLPEDFPVRFSD